MRQRFNTKQRNYIILGLCSILLVMAAGYAAFRTQLTINGTSNITSEFKVLITDIQSNTLSGDATDAEAPSHTETTATFKTNLVSPGDSMQYDITVENRGDIDAVLESIDVNTSENEAILFETSGIKRGDKLLPEESDVLTVVVTYNPEVTDQPENLNATVTVTLNYVQDDGSILPEPEGPSIGGISVPTVESGDGLYEDEYESGRYIYRGTNPNNYIEFNNELWRIIAKEADGTYKIIRNDLVTFDELGVTSGFSYSAIPFDINNARSTERNTYCDDPRYGCGVYAAVSGEFLTPSGSKKGTVTEDSTIKKILNDGYSDDDMTIKSYYSTLSSEAKGQMTSHTFNIGAVEYLDESGAEADSIEKNIAGEKMYQWTGNIGLVNVSDMLKASLNPLCKSATDQLDKIMNSSQSTCNNNYLFEITEPTGFWSINAFGSESGAFHGRSDSTDAWNGARSSGMTGIGAYYAYNDDHHGARPVLYLKSNISLEGEGTQSDPFTIS